MTQVSSPKIDVLSHVFGEASCTTRNSSVSKDGLFIRYIGRNDKGTPEKFRLGYDPLVAEERVRLIAALWQEIEERTSARPFWDRKTLEAAKAIAKGMPATCPRVTMKTRSSMSGVFRRSAKRPELGSSRWTPRATSQA